MRMPYSACSTPSMSDTVRKEVGHMQTKYRSGVGSLTYAMQGTRPDIAYSVSLLSRFLAAPTDQHYALLIRVLKYLNTYPSLGIQYRRSADQGLICYTDATWGDKAILHDGKSTVGCILFFAGGALLWSSKRMPTPATSTMEAEYRSQCDGIRHVDGFINFFGELGMPLQLPIPIYADNLQAIDLANRTFKGEAYRCPTPLSTPSGKHGQDRIDLCSS
jgi:hypothetical protein